MIDPMPIAARMVADVLRRAATEPADRVLAELLVIARRQVEADFALLLERTDAHTAEVYAADPLHLIPGGVIRPDLIAGALAEGRPHFETPTGLRIPASLRGAHAVVPLGKTWALVVGRTNGVPFDATEQTFLVDMSGPLQIVLRWDTATRAADAVQARFDAIAQTLPHGLLFIDDDGDDAWVNQAAADLLGVADGAVDAHTIAQAMARLHSQADAAVAQEAARLAASPHATLIDWRWALHGQPPRLLSVSTTPVRTRRKHGRLWLLMDITQQDAAQRELREANAELVAARQAADAANRAKSLFLANMSHELRTPLNAIVGLAQVMQDDGAMAPAQRENMAIIVQSSDHLLTMINEVLDISKIEAGKMDLHEADFDLRTTVRTLQAMLQQKAAAKGIALVVDVAPEAPARVHADQGKLRQVLINLLNNAVKFTSEGSVTLRVGYEPDGQGVFVIEDTGAGIATEELDQLFSEFQQTASGRQSLEGTGLGLPISRKFVQMMGGDITVASRPGIGTTFTVRLPLPSATELGAEGAGQDRVVGLAPGSPQVRVLIVDDVANNRKVLCQVLQPLELEVREASSGEEALEVWAAWQPDLIWLDIRMGGMDGMEVARTIRRHEANQKTPRTCIIAITASVMAGDQDSVLGAGCDDIVPKPFRRSLIFDKMAKHLGLTYVYQASDAMQSPALMSDAAVAPVGTSASTRVLIVDDNVVGQKLTVRMLQKLRVEADVAGNGEEALLALRTHPYPLVFMDMQMPVMGGLEATRHIRAEWGRDRPVIIALTGEEAEDLNAAQEAGIDGWMVKPLRIEDLRLTLERWLS